MSITLSKEQAVEIATDYGKSQNLDSFGLDFAALDGSRPDLKWRIYLRFNDRRLDQVGLPDGVVVIVDASTGTPFIGKSL